MQPLRKQLMHQYRSRPRYERQHRSIPIATARRKPGDKVNGSMIYQYIAQVAQFATFRPRISMEIGALDGVYSRALQAAFGLRDENLHLVEPNPSLSQKLRTSFPDSNHFSCAVSDTA